VSKSLAIDTLGRPQLVQGGFAVPIARGLVLYGQRRGDDLISLALDVTERDPDFSSAQPVLQSVCDGLRVDLVNWYRATVLLQSQTRNVV
jgi:hypothetical protein